MGCREWMMSDVDMMMMDFMFSQGSCRSTCSRMLWAPIHVLQPTMMSFTFDCSTSLRSSSN